jgi:5'-nucleotidase
LLTYFSTVDLPLFLLLSILILQKYFVMKSRRHFLKNGALATAAMLVAEPFTSLAKGKSMFPFAGSSKSNTITLLHTSDLHNQLSPVTDELYKGLGGLEKTASMIAQLKNENKHTVLLDAGDIFCGNTSFQHDHTATLQLMRSLNYDAALLGNRDYAAGTDYLQQQWHEKHVPLIASNYTFSNSWLKTLHLPYKIVQKGNTRIGIMAAGIDMNSLPGTNGNDHVQYKDPVKELNAIATMLRQKEKCQLIVCLSHLGYKNKSSMDDCRLATQSKNIDVIIGAHSHTFMTAPVIAMNSLKEEVIINHAGYGGIVLGNMNIGFDKDGRKNKLEFNNKLIGASAGLEKEKFRLIGNLES